MAMFDLPYNPLSVAPYATFEDDGQMLPGKGSLIAISVKNLPRFAEVMARAIAFARERAN